MVNKIILWLSIIINKRGFFCFFCSQSRYLSRKCPNFLATCVWNPGVTWSSLPSCSWSATTRLLYKKTLWSLFYFWHSYKKTKQKTDTSVLAYWDKGSTAFCKSLEPLTLNSQADFSALSFSNLQEYFSRLLGGHSKLLFGCFCLLLWSLSRWSHTSSVMLRLGSRQAMMFIAPRLQVVTVIQVLKTILICLLICCL